MKNKRVVQSAKRPQAYVPRNRIATGQDKARVHKRTATMRQWWKEVLIKNGWLDALDAYKFPMKGTPIKAFINQGRWLANCPDKECAGAEVIDPTDPVFMCLSCGNISNRHNGAVRFIPVSIPDVGFCERLTKLLLERPNSVNRNWHPDKESLDDLKKENKRHRKGV